MSVFCCLSKHVVDPKGQQSVCFTDQEKLVSSNMLTFCENDSFIYYRNHKKRKKEEKF